MPPEATVIALAAFTALPYLQARLMGYRTGRHRRHTVDWRACHVHLDQRHPAHTPAKVNPLSA